MHQLNCDYTGLPVELFLFEKIENGDASDKEFMLNFEIQLKVFLNDGPGQIKLHPMRNSYKRLLAHKIAALYNFEHHVDRNDKCRIIITKTIKSAVPLVTLNEMKRMDTIEKRQMKKV